MVRVLMIPFEGTDDEALEHIRKAISEKGYDVKICDKIKIPKVTMKENKLYVKDLFPLLGYEMIIGKADIALGIIDKDIYGDDAGYLFGMQHLDMSLISTYRLKDKDMQKFYDRAAKEAIHEILHVEGHVNCAEPKCVMHLSYSPEDIDEKNTTFCKTCDDAMKPAPLLPKNKGSIMKKIIDMLKE